MKSITNSRLRSDKKESIRGTQGQDAKLELLDWENKWLPPPVVWEDRGDYDACKYTSHCAFAFSIPALGGKHLTNIADSGPSLDAGVR